MLTNKATFTSIELAAIFGSENLINIDDNFSCQGVLIDTRLIEEGNLFVALRGENVDGHSLVEQAFKSGASACLIERQFAEKICNDFPHFKLIITDDNIAALGLIANYHRLRFNYPLLAIGGSNGKTTTKEMIASVLSQKFNVLKTFGNYNNKIGVPLMLLQISDDYNMIVLEIGTNTPGEIFDLSKIVKPTHALITNIGKEHLEFLIDLDGVELEETYLLSEVRSEGFTFINYDDERLKNYGQILGKFKTYGIHEHAQFRCSYSLSEKLNPIITIHNSDGDLVFKMQTIGYTSALNAIAALCVGDHFEVQNELMIDALSKFEPLLGASGYGRMALQSVGGVVIINDTYNANPDSMLAAFKNIELLQINGKKIVVLGDMRELGDASNEEHINILNKACEIADIVFVTGEEMMKANSVIDCDKIRFHKNSSEIAKELLAYSTKDDFILFKGSRGMKMELIIEEFTNLIGEGK